MKHEQTIDENVTVWSAIFGVWGFYRQWQQSSKKPAKKISILIFSNVLPHVVFIQYGIPLYWCGL